MGIVTIRVSGSFKPTKERHFTAQNGGHAKAVAQAIRFLSGEILPRAIEQDHQLQDEGQYPTDKFGLGVEIENYMDDISQDEKNEFR